jgi:putative heme-binding domain-containing protein
LAMNGDRSRGRDVFEKNCVQCHSIGGSGGQVGPSLSGLASRTKEALLVDLFDPSRQVNPEFLSYTVELRNGDSLTGLIVAEAAATLTLRRPNVADETIPRERIRSIQASNLSLMPDGLEATMTTENVADLLAFLVSVQ